MPASEGPIGFRPDDLTAELSRLVRIPSVTPTHAGPRSGTPGELRIASYAAERLRRVGADVETVMVMPDRPNVIAVLRGATGRWLGIDVHSDTAGVEQMTGNPFDGRVEAGRVYGRGAVDTKATLAAVLVLLDSLRAAGRRPLHNLLIAVTCDEEGTARGAPALAARLQERGIALDQMIVAEPTGCAPVHGHKGVLRLVCEISGVAAHSAYPDRGRNALVAAARLTMELSLEHERIQSRPASPLGHGSLTVTGLESGRGASVVPDHARVTIDRRLVPGESAVQLAVEYDALARRAAGLPVRSVTTHAIDPFHCPPDSDLVARFSGWTGGQPRTVAYCTNAWAYDDVARERMVIGPGSIEQAHGDVEWVAADELLLMTRALASWWTQD